MKVTCTTTCLIERLDSPKIYKDSTLMYHIARELQKQGYDCFRKDLSKEPGNMLSSGCYGIIARDRSYQIYYSSYCIRDACTDYNNGKLILDVWRII